MPIKVKLIPKYPVGVTSGAGLDLSVVNGRLTGNLDFDGLAEIDDPDFWYVGQNPDDGSLAKSKQRVRASQAQAQAGTDNETLMTPLRVTEAVAVAAPPLFPVYDSRSTASGTSIRSAVKRLKVDFYSPSYATPSTLTGGGNYRRISLADLGSYPSQSYFRSSDRYLPDGTSDNTNGGYWVLDELSPSPLQFGARGDGVTADYTPVQACLTYAALRGVTANLEGRQYICGTSDLTVDCSVDGRGASLVGRLRIGASNISIRRLTISTNIVEFAIYVRGQSGSRLSNVTLDGVRVLFDSAATPASSRLAIYATYVDNLRIVNSNFMYGLELISCANYVVHGNTFDGELQNNNELIQPTLRSYGIISNNTFLNSYDNCIDMYSSGERSIIIGNRFIGCRVRLGTVIEIKITLSDNPTNTSSDTNGWDEQIVIANNYFGGTTATSAIFTSFISIYYLDSRASPSFSWAETPRNMIIHGNIFDGFDATNLGAQTVCAIYLDTVSSAIISGNIVRAIDIGGSGSDFSSAVWIENSRDIIVKGNRLNIRNGTAISLHRDCQGITLDGNHMLDDLNKSYSLRFGIRIAKLGSRAAPTINGLAVTNNRSKATTSSFQQPYVSGASITNMVMHGNDFQNETAITVVSDSIITNNIFACTPTRFGALQIGTTSATCTRLQITGNSTLTVSGSEKPGISVTRLSRSNIMQNIGHHSTYGILVDGTSTAGELEYLNIKDNFSNTQTQTNFPHYSGMHATDTGTLQAANNQKLS